jgi:hypothetical protein
MAGNVDEFTADRPPVSGLAVQRCVRGGSYVTAWYEVTTYFNLNGTGGMGGRGMGQLRSWFPVCV